MDVFGILTSKPVLIGLHLGAAIVGIDAFLWFAGEAKNANPRIKRLRIPGILGLISFILSWIFGGFYYVTYYGSLVKPIIKSGLAPWAHNIAMETKEHVFLFIIPLAATAAIIAFLSQEEFDGLKINRQALLLAGFIAFLGLAIGLAGFVISSAARWG